MDFATAENAGRIVERTFPWEEGVMGEVVDVDGCSHSGVDEDREGFLAAVEGCYGYSV